MSPPVSCPNQSPLVATEATDSSNADLRAPSFRPGQGNVFQSLMGFFESSARATYVKLPGSFGKTFLYVTLIEQRGEPAMVLFPSIDLLRQARAEFAKFAPHLTVGMLRKDGTAPDTDVVLGTVQRALSLHKQGKLTGALHPLTIADEAHELLGKKRSAMIREMLKTTRVIGFTATDEYYETKRLSQLLGPPVHTMTFREARDLGAIAPHRTEAIRVPVDLSHVRLTTGDYHRQELQAAMPVELTARAIAEFHRLYHSGEQGYVQCLGRKHAKDTALVLRECGIKAAAITGDMKKSERRKVLEDFDKGEIELIVGAKLLIQGINNERASVAYNFPSMSKLAVEQRGYRVLRLDPKNPEKVGTVVEIITNRIPTRTPPLTFSEVVDGTILKGSAETGRKVGPRRGQNSSVDGVTFLTDADDVLGVIRNLRSESGPWGRLALQRIERGELTRLVEEIHKGWIGMLGACVRNRAFVGALLSGAIEPASKLTSTDRMVLEDASTYSWPRHENSAAAAEIEGDATAVVSKRFALSPGQLSRWFLTREDDSPEDFETWQAVSNLNGQIAPLVKRVATAYEPLIAGVAMASGFDTSDPASGIGESWYELGAETLIRSMHDIKPTQYARFERYAERALVKAFTALQNGEDESSASVAGIDSMPQLQATDELASVLSRDTPEAILHLLDDVLEDFDDSERQVIRDNYVRPMLAHFAPHDSDTAPANVTLSPGLRSKFEEAVRSHERLRKLVPDSLTESIPEADPFAQGLQTPIGDAATLCNWLRYRTNPGRGGDNARSKSLIPNDAWTLAAVRNLVRTKMHPEYQAAIFRLIPELVLPDMPLHGTNGNDTHLPSSQDTRIDLEAMQCLGALVIAWGINATRRAATDSATADMNLLDTHGLFEAIPYEAAISFVKKNLIDIPLTAFAAARLVNDTGREIEDFFQGTARLPLWWSQRPKDIGALAELSDQLPVWVTNGYGAMVRQAHFVDAPSSLPILLRNFRRVPLLPAQETLVFRACLASRVGASNLPDRLREPAKALLEHDVASRIMTAMPKYKAALSALALKRDYGFPSERGLDRAVNFMKRVVAEADWREILLAQSQYMSPIPGGALHRALSVLGELRHGLPDAEVTDDSTAHLTSLLKGGDLQSKVIIALRSLRELPW